MAIRKRVWTTAAGEEKQAWVVDYRDQGGKRRLKTFQRKKDADAWWNGRASYEVAQGIHTPDSVSVTVKEACDRWIQDGRNQDPPLEESTVRQREQHARLHIVPFIGGMKLSEITAPGVRAFMDKLKEEGRSLAMRKRVLVSLKACLTFCQGQGLVAQNVATPISVSSRGGRVVRDIEQEIPSKAELRAMMDNAPARWRPFIVTAIMTGMRASELRGLIWQNVDLEAGVIRVRQRADRWNKIGPPKSKAGTRDIPLAPMALNALKEWKLAYPRPVIGEDEDGTEIRAAFDPSHYVFPNDRGNIEFHANIANRVFAPLQIALGITVDTGEKGADGEPILKPKWGLHALRHAAASLFIEQGWKPKKVQTIMGHSSIQVTYDTYGKLFADEDSDAEAMARMQAALLAD